MIARDITERKQIEEALQESQQRFTAFMDNLPGFAWMKDLQGRYVYANKVLEQLREYQHGWLGKTDADLWPAEIAAQYQANDQKVVAIRQPLQTVEPYLVEGKQSFSLVSKFPIFDATGAVAMVGGASVDITERIKAEEALRALSARLLKAQDEERRRIARELHDSTAQKLAALAITLGWVKDSMTGDEKKKKKLVEESLAIVQDCSQEVRTMSYLLHPPILDELGLGSALRSYVDGFSKRSRIEVSLDLPVKPDRLPSAVELALFRIVQECLANIHRHSGSKTASIRLAWQANEIVLEIHDQGRGMFCENKDRRMIECSGVGIAGMKQRLHELGGRLEIVSGDQGTSVRAFVPLRQTA